MSDSNPVCFRCKKPGLLYVGGMGPIHLGPCESYGIGNDVDATETVTKHAIENRNRMLITYVGRNDYDDVLKTMEEVLA